MSLRLTVQEKPSATDRQAVLTPLIAYNVGQVGDPRFQPISILLTDDDGNQVGGLFGAIFYDWMSVELIAVPEQHRGEGYGTKLMDRAEEVARANNCVGIWLDTFEFQARGFYEKLGFELFGELPNHPKGHKRFFLHKCL